MTISLLAYPTTLLQLLGLTPSLQRAIRLAKLTTVASPQVADIEAAERAKMKDKVTRIVDHGINCFINRQLIYNYPEELFADAGVSAVEHADFVGIERLALVLGGEIVSTFDNPQCVFPAQPRLEPVDRSSEPQRRVPPRPLQCVHAAQESGSRVHALLA